MSETSIGLSNKLKSRLREMRLDSETSYEDTIWRLLGENTTEYVTEAEVKSIAKEIIDEGFAEQIEREAQE